MVKLLHRSGVYIKEIRGHCYLSNLRGFVSKKSVVAVISAILENLYLQKSEVAIISAILENLYLKKSQVAVISAFLENLYLKKSKVAVISANTLT